MNNLVVSLLLTLLIGVFFWGGWATVARLSAITDPFVRGFVVNIVTVLGFLPFLPGRLTFDLVRSDGVKILLVAGTLNFFGHLLFPHMQMLATDRASLFAGIIPILCFLSMVVGGVWFFHDVLRPAQIFFVVVIILGVVGFIVTSMR
jgi:hypothetical protein